MIKFLKIFFILAASIYILGGAALYVLQEQFIFKNDRTRVAPEQEWIEVVELKTPDEESLVAWYSPPTIDQCPTFLFFHGNGGRLDQDRGRYQHTHDAGFGVLALAYRGYSGSTGKPTEKGLHIDAQTAWDWLVKTKGLAPEDIIIQGHSMGSGVAVQLAARNDPAAMLILEAPFESLQSVVQGVIKIWPASLLVKHKFRSDLHIGNIKRMPILIAHGTSDSVVPFSQSKRLYERVSGPKRHMTFEGSEHNTLVEDGLYEDAIWPALSRNIHAFDCKSPKLTRVLND